MKELFLTILMVLSISVYPARAAETTQTTVESTICEGGNYEETDLSEEDIEKKFSEFYSEDTPQHTAWQIVESYEVCRDTSESKIYIYESDIAGIVTEFMMSDVGYEMSDDGTTITVPDLEPEFKICLISGDADPVDVD